MARQQNRGSSSRSSSGGTENRGFASMDKEKQREIARKGGQHSHDSDRGGSGGGGRSGSR